MKQVLNDNKYSNQKMRPHNGEPGSTHEKNGEPAALTCEENRKPCSISEEPCHLKAKMTGLSYWSPIEN